MRISIPSLNGFLLLIVLLGMLTLGHASTEAPNEWFSQSGSSEVTIDVDLFMTSRCEHCHKADDFFHEISEKNAWLHIKRHVINEDKRQLIFFADRLKHFDSTDFSVPTIMFCDSRWLGFDSAETTGKALLRALTYCHQQIQKEHALTSETRDTLRQWSGSNHNALKLEIRHSATPLERILITALLDAFSSCSFFCLWLFLAILWLHPQQRLARFVLGFTFIMAVGVVHLVRFVFAETYQVWGHYLIGLSWFSGGMLLLYAALYVRDRWVLGVQRTFVWALPVLITSVIAVYANQQTCDFRVAALFQQWLQTKTLTYAAYYFYQLTYIFFYVLPLGLLLLCYSIFDVHPRKILSVCALIICVLIGMLLLFYPAGLSSVGLSCAVMAISMCASWIYYRTHIH